MWTRSLPITIVMVTLMLGAMFNALPATQHNLSPVFPTHASLYGGDAGEGPSSETRSIDDRCAFLDVTVEEGRFSGPPGEPSDITFNFTERNGVGLTMSSLSWMLRTLQGNPVVDGSGTVPCTIQMDGLSSTEWTTAITISSELYREMMFKGRDQLRLTVTFEAVDANGNAISVTRALPAHLTQRVAMLVEEDVFPLIRDRLLRFEDDANLRGSVEFIHRTGDWNDAAAIRSLLKQLWRDESITGAMVWGHLPFAMWDMVHSEEKHEIFPIPVFYEDMDGSFTDTNGDGIYDRHLWGENDGCEIWTSFVMPPRELVPEENLDPSGQGTGGGLSASYYNTRNLYNLRMSRVDPTLDFYWQVDLPQEIDDDDFSIKWTGRIRADASELYTLSPLHGGGLRIWIDGNLVHDQWSGTTWKKWEHQSTVYMTKGWHNIRIEYNNNNWGFDGAVRLLWTSDHVLAGTLNDWLDRSHAYHQGDLDYNERALLFMDYGYGIKCRMRDPILNNHITPIYGDRVVVKGCTNTTAADDYIRALADGYELVSVWSHAGSAGHWIAYEDMPNEVNGTAPSYKIRETPAGLVTLIWGCHAGDFGGSYEGEDVSFLSDNLAANYAFSTPYGLACAAATRSIGSTFKEVYWAWENGSSLATGFAANLEVEYDRATIERTAPSIAEDMWVKDVVLMGDPFLRIDHRPWNLSLDIDDGADFTLDTNVTLRPSGVDVQEVRFKSAGGQWSPWEAFCATKEWTIGQEYGAHRVVVQARNGWGNCRYQASDVITLVSTTSRSVSMTIDDGAETSNSLTVDVSIDLGEADPAKVMMRLKDDGSEWTDWMPFVGSTQWTFSKGDGERTVMGRFISDCGLWSNDTQDSIIIDTTPPVSSFELTGELGMGEWYVSSVSYSLNATDALSGIGSTECSLDGGPWSAYTVPVEVAVDGLHELRFCSSDGCGNHEDPITVNFKIDTQGPKDLSVVPRHGVGCIPLPSLDVLLEATDDHSGLESMRFSLDGVEWGQWLNFETERFLVLPTEEGEHTVDWQVRDIAGNVATMEEPLTIVLDKTAPALVSHEPAEGEVDVPVVAAILLTFDEVVHDMMDGGLDPGIGFLLQDDEGNPVLCTSLRSDDNLSLEIHPEEPMDHYTSYTVIVFGRNTDVAGNELNGGEGYVWSFTTAGLPPGAPDGLTAEATNTSVKLSWSSPDFPGSGDFQGYNVYRMKAGETGFQFMAAVTSTLFEDGGVEEEVQYHYAVRAYTSYTEGDESNVASAIVIHPPEDPGEDPEGPEGSDPNDTGDTEGRDEGGPALTAYATVAIVAVIAVALITAVAWNLRRE